LTPPFYVGLGKGIRLKMSGIGLPARLRRMMKSLAFAITCVALVVTSAQAASAATATHIAPRPALHVRPAQTSPSPTISGAQLLTIGDAQSGGGEHVDFWLIKLTGGDEVQFSVTEPGQTFDFDLYPPATTDADFADTTPVTLGATNGSSPDDITVQAPYTGTFILAVCENTANYDCSNTDSGSGTNPMNPYTFTPTILTNPCGTGTGEVEAGGSIASASLFSIPNCQAGGGQHVDFWLVKLTGGDQVTFSVTEPGQTYDFDLYPPGTTDADFADTAPATIAATNGSSPDSITLQAPYTGTFVLAVCENTANYDCSNTDSGSGANPMSPYTFTPATPVNPCSSGAGEVRAGSSIAGASLFSIPNCQAGGGQHVDFWLVKLTGGDQVTFSVTEPGQTYDFDLYPPGTTDADFADTAPATIAATNGSSTDYITLQAPYTGTFVLAVCEDSANYDCSYTDSGSGANPMSPYTFTPAKTGNPCGSGTGEVRANGTIAGAPQYSAGTCQAGGGQHVDIWLARLTGGEQLRLDVTSPGQTYDFDLYPPGTTDADFADTAPAVIAATNGSSPDYITLQAPRTGTFVLAVCENSANYDCSYTDSGSGTNPMNPYTFASAVVGQKTSTALKLSASSIADGKEKSLKFSVAVKAQFTGTPTGTVTVKAGKKKICTVKLAAGKGTCSPTSNTLLAAGSYSIVASYNGSSAFPASTSKSVKLKVTKAKKGKAVSRLDVSQIALGRPRPALISIAA
jgi:Bacterial Ig-like domain (group 3)